MNKLVADIQSRIARRGTYIASLEADYIVYKAVADHLVASPVGARRARKICWAMRDTIHPLAIDQKLDRDIMQSVIDLERVCTIHADTAHFWFNRYYELKREWDAVAATLEQR